MLNDLEKLFAVKSSDNSFYVSDSISKNIKFEEAEEESETESISANNTKISLSLKFSNNDKAFNIVKFIKKEKISLNFIVNSDDLIYFFANKTLTLNLNHLEKTLFTVKDSYYDFSFKVKKSNENLYLMKIVLKSEQ